MKIEKVNYFPEMADYGNDYNAKVLYRSQRGKLYLAHVFVDFFNKYIHVSYKQPKECKVLKGLERALNNWAIKTKYF